MEKSPSIPELPHSANDHRGYWKRRLQAVLRLKYVKMVWSLLVLALFLAFCFHLGLENYTSKSKSKNMQPFLDLDRVYEKPIALADNYPSDDWVQKKLINNSALQLEIGELLPRPNSFFFVESSGSS